MSARQMGAEMKRCVIASLMFCALGACGGTSTAAPSTTSPPVTTPTVDQWAADSGLSGLLTSQGNDLDKINTDSSASDTVSESTDCGTLLTDSKAILAILPAPNATVTADLQSSMTAYVTGARACQSGDYTQANTYFDAGQTSLGRAKDDIAALPIG
jgi:hypothetical protein